MGCDAITDDEISLLKEIAKCKKLLKAAKAGSVASGWEESMIIT